MRKESITCDCCSKELIVDSGYPHHFTLELKVIDTGINTSGTTYCVAQFPPFEGTRNFCDKNCLKEWIKDN